MDANDRNAAARRRSPRALRARARPACGEGGFMLVELLVAAMLVAVIALGVSGAIVSASRGSGNDRHRSVAASIAQQDQERMRGFKPAALSNYTNSRTVTVAGTAYTVESTARWVSDSSGVVSCSNNSQRANYLRITSSVSWPGMGPLKPIALRSLVAPPSGSFTATTGSLAVRVTDQADNAISGVPLTLGAPANLSQTTDSDGCAVFGGVEAGTYPLTYSRSGYVDPSGQTSVSEPPVSVVAGTTTTITRLYAPGGSVRASFDTKVGTNPAQPSRAQSLTVSHPNLPPPGRRMWDPPGVLQDSIDATNLFPFSSGYGVYAGMCQANDPTTYDPNYYASNPGLVTVAPGGSHAVTVRQPAINVRVTRLGVPLPTGRVTVRLTSSGCTETFPGPHGLTEEGALQSPGFPFGTYELCADDGVRRVRVPGVANIDPRGTPPIELAVPATGLLNRGTCP